MATHRREELRRGRARRSAPPPASSASRSPPASQLGRLSGRWPHGVFVTGTGTEVGKTVVAAAIARTLAAEGKRVAVFKPAVTGLDEGVETDHALLRRAAGSSQSDEEIAPYRYGPPASPHLAAALAGEEIDPERLRQAAASRGRGRRRDRLRGRRRPARPARPRPTSSATSPSTSATRW